MDLCVVSWKYLMDKKVLNLLKRSFTKLLHLNLVLALASKMVVFKIIVFIDLLLKTRILK